MTGPVGDPGLDPLFDALRDALRDRVARDALESLGRLVGRREAERKALSEQLSPAVGHAIRSRISAVHGYAALLADAHPGPDADRLREAIDLLIAEIDAIPAWSPPPDPPARSRPFVLVVDDDEDAWRILRKNLRKVLDCDVAWATDGEAALSIARERTPDLITLDVCMPGVDGWQTLGALKADPSLAHVPVIMMSILHEQGRGVLLGADHYLTKPLDRNQLVSAIQRFAPRPAAHVLVVDDTPSAREIARRLLEASGYRVQEAVNGADALAKMRAAPPDLVLLDLMMPEVDGFEVVAQMAADPSLAAIPTLVLTALQLDAAERERLSRAVDGVLPKGLPLSVLLERVAASLMR